MASESDSDLIISKRPKTKSPIKHDIHSSNFKSNNDGDLIIKDTENECFYESDLVEHKKAVKRTRESDEESSITSDDEAMSKKRVRKNSEDKLLSCRPKKVVSAAARKRREKAKTLRESKLAALETDSEYDSDEMYSSSEKPKLLDEDVKRNCDEKSEDNISRTKQLDSDSENEKSSNSFIKGEKVSSEKNINKVEHLSDKNYHKNEESSSAYNSDSQDEIRKQSSVMELQHTTTKKDDMNKSEKKSNVTPNSLNEEKQFNPTESSGSNQSSNEVSHLRSDLPSRCNPQVKSKDQSECCLSDSVLQESKVQTETNKSNKNQHCSDSIGGKKLENLDSNHLNTKEKNPKVIKHNSENTSSDNETPIKTERRSHEKNAKMKVNSVKESLEGQTIFNSGSSSEDDYPHSKNKLTVVETKNLRKGQLDNPNCHASDDENSSNDEKCSENSRSPITLKTKKLKNKDKSNKSLKFLNNSTDSSDADRPMKKTKSSVCSKKDADERKKFKKQPSIRSSSDDESSEDEQPFKKTKSSMGKTVSDSEDSDNFVLKKGVEPKKSKREIKESSKENVSKKEKTILKNKSVISQDKNAPSHSKNSDKNSGLSDSEEEADLLKKAKYNSKTNTDKNRKFEKKNTKTLVSNESNSSDDDKPLRKGESVVRNKTKIDDKKKKSKNLAENQNSSVEENSSEDEQPPKKTKSCINEIQTDSDSEKSDDKILLVKHKREQKAKNKDDESSSDSDDKPLGTSNSTQKNSDKINVNNQKKDIKKSKTREGVTDKEDDSKDFKKRRGISRKNEGENKKSERKGGTSSNVSSSESSNDSDVPLAKPSKSRGKQVTKESSVKIHEKTISSSKFSDTSDSENETLKKQVSKSVAKKRSIKEKCEKPGTLERNEDVNDSNNSDSSSAHLKKNTKHEFSDSAVSSDSDDEEEKKNTKSKKSKSSSSENDSDSNSRTDETKKNKKVLSKMDMRINNLKKYIRACGIRINNYAALWEGCRSDKQRADKLAKFLEDQGMKGRPTLQKCKKLRIKLEKKKEVEELDLNNIIDNPESTGRYKCRSSRRQSAEIKTPEVKKEAAEKAAELKQRFSRIKDLIDSDSGSD